MTPARQRDQISVLVVDHHPIVREGIKTVLANAGDVVLTADVGSTAAALKAIAETSPDLVLLDLDLGEEDGLDLLARVAKAAPAAKTLVLTGVRDRARHEAALVGGARGLMMKDRPADLLLRAIRKVHAGELWFDRELVDATLQRAIRSEPGADPSSERLHTLTAREREIVTLIGQGLRNADIASRLGISNKTVRNHLSTIYDKLGVADRLELLVFSYDHGLVARR